MGFEGGDLQLFTHEIRPKVLLDPLLVVPLSQRPLLRLLIPLWWQLSRTLSRLGGLQEALGEWRLCLQVPNLLIKIGRRRLPRLSIARKLMPHFLVHFLLHKLDLVYR